jgi:MATE family multidrug resistance protein
MSGQKDEQLIVSEQKDEHFIPTEKDNKSVTREQDEPITLKETIKTISLLAFPTILFSLCIFLQQTINLVFLSRYYTGQEKEDVTEAVGLSHLYINCLMLSITTGLITGFETLGANAFGSGNYKLMGIYYHRAQLIGYVFVLCSLLTHFFIGPLLIGLTTSNENVVSFVRQYMRVTMFFVFWEVPFATGFRFINIIDKPLANFIPIIFSIALHPLWCYIFINVLDLGLVGGGISIIISQMLNAISVTFYINVIKPLPAAVFWYNKKSFKGWWKYFKFSLPSCILTCGDWWGQELLAIIAMLIGADDYYVHILIANIFVNTYSISLAYGFSTNILIGTYMGKGDVKSCQTIRNTGLAYGISFMALVSILLFSLKTYVIAIFNVPDRLLDICYKLMNILVIFILFDLSQTVLAGVLRGYGKQFIASVPSIINYYVVQIGLAALLGIYFELGVAGVWYAALICGLSMTIVYAIIIFFFINLEKIRMETFDRIQNDAQDLTMSRRSYSRKSSNVNIPRF